jgi:putative selenate reductase molybdopterin-binding subunit
VIKPRIGGGFGGKQEILIEDVAHPRLPPTPGNYEYSLKRNSSRPARHPMRSPENGSRKMDVTPMPCTP